MEYHRLTRMSPGVDSKKAPPVCAQLSCQDPQSNLVACLRSGDLSTFSSLLADVAPLEDKAITDDEKEVGSRKTIKIVFKLLLDCLGRFYHLKF